MIPRFRTLTRQFGALYAFVLLLVVAVCAATAYHLHTIVLDSSRVMEESREQVLAARLVTSIDSLQGLVSQPTGIDDLELQRARALVESTYADLSGLDLHDDDPSRPEHQDAERRIGEELSELLLSAHRLLETRGTDDWRPEVLQVLALAKHDARVLLSEARDEAAEASEDLEGRARATTTILALTFLSAVFLLGAALYLVHRGVVRPLKHVSQVSERFGLGEDALRIRVDNRDEIGVLAASFNAMADRLTEAKADLEQRVRNRTHQFLRAARLADLGVLASGIAHEINTPLASIGSCADGLRRRVAAGTLEPELLEEYARTIGDETLRAREITTRMLSLVRREASEVASVLLHDVLEQAATAMKHRAHVAGVRLETEPVAPDARVRVNPGELVQVLVNLLANACDASPAGSVVSAGAELRGATLHLHVTDRGAGIPEEDLDRVFEPFYTTKAPNEGTGLGLALVSTLVQHRGGRIEVESEVGVGTTFRLELPADWSARA